MTYLCSFLFITILKEKDVSKKVSFWSTLIKTFHQVQQPTNVSAFKVQVFFTKIVSQKVQNSIIVAVVLNSNEQPGCVFVTSFRPSEFVQMAFDKPFSYTTQGYAYGCS